MEKIVLASIVGILAMWDFDSVESGDPPIPLHRSFPNFIDPSRTPE